VALFGDKKSDLKPAWGGLFFISVYFGVTCCGPTPRQKQYKKYSKDKVNYSPVKSVLQVDMSQAATSLPSVDGSRYFPYLEIALEFEKEQ
jgi:hypothetical protein